MATVVANLFEVASDDPAAGALVIGSDVRSTNHERPAGVADSLQFSEHGVSAPSSEISAVLKSEPTRADFSDDADRLEEEAAAFAFDALAVRVGRADVLAGRASDDDVGEVSEIPNKSACRKSADIFIDRHSDIILSVEGAPPIDGFARGDGDETRAVHAKRPATGGGAEQIEDRHSHVTAPELRGGRSGRRL